MTSLVPLLLALAPLAPGPPDLKTELVELAARHPNACEVDTLGRSSEGRDLWLGLLARGEARRARPGVLLFDHGLAGKADRSADLLRIAAAILESQASDPRVQQLLERASIHVAPALDPDRSLGTRATSDRDSAFDHDFPAGWLPASREPLAGPYPLHLSETRALATFLDEHPGIVAVVCFVPARETGSAGAPDALELALAADFPTLGVRTGGSLRPGPGSVLAWCREGVGATLVGLLPPPRDVGEETAHHARAAELLVELLASLPRLSLEAGPATGLGEGTVRIDVRIRNHGRFSTGVERTRWGADSGEVELVLDGVRLVAAAVRDAGSPLFRVTEPRRASDGRPALRLAPMGPGEERTVRLVLEPDGPVAMEASALRAGRTRLQLSVR